MMKHIYKYEIAQKAIVLAGQFLFNIEMPKDAKMLKVGEQDESYFLWALVDSSKETENVTIATIMTGEPIPESFDEEYLDTLVSYEGQFVVHFWKLRNVDRMAAGDI